MENVIETTEAPAEIDDAQADADFAEGFGQSETPTEETPPVVDEPVETLEPEPVATPETPTPVELTKLDEAQIQRILASVQTVDNIQATLEKSFGTAFGKIGGIERTLKSLQEATPSGQALTVSAEDFEEMKADFPELADMHVKGLNRALSKLKGTGGAPAVDQGQVNAIVASEVAKVRKESALQVADLTLKGWRQQVNSPEFQAWFATQGAEDPESPVVLGQHLDAFKAHQEKTQQAKPKTPAALSRRDRLVEAVVPRGAGGHAPAASSEEDIFQAGYAGR